MCFFNSFYCLTGHSSHFSPFWNHFQSTVEYFLYMFNIDVTLCTIYSLAYLWFNSHCSGQRGPACIICSCISTKCNIPCDKSLTLRETSFLDKQLSKYVLWGQTAHTTEVKYRIYISSIVSSMNCRDFRCYLVLTSRISFTEPLLVFVQISRLVFWEKGLRP